MFFFICFVVSTTCASPVGIPRDIYRIYLYINVCLYIYLHNSFFSPLPVSCILRLRSGYGWSLIDCSCSMREMLIRLDTSAVFMWCCITWGSVSVWNPGGLTLVNRLQSFRRCRAVCSSFSGQLHSGEGAFFLL
jgi:hypothetical protein